MIAEIRIDKIFPNPWQTRLGEDPEHIADLADSIKSIGLMQAPIGRHVEGGVELAFGHSRLAAYKLLADQSTIYGDMPVDIRPLTDEQMAVMAWDENEKRRDVTPIERALAIQKRMQSFTWTQDQIADKLGISRPVVSNALRLLKLPEDVQDDVQHGRLTERQALALLPLYDLDPEMVRAHRFEDSIALIVNLARGGASSDDLRQRVTTAVDWLKSLVQPALVPAAPEVVETLEPEMEPEPAEEPASAPQAEDGRTRFPTPQELAGKLPTSEHKPAPEPTRPASEPAEPVAPLKPLTWAESTLVLTITLLPVNGAGEDRPAMVGLRANNGMPAMRYTTESHLELTSPEILGLIDQVRNNF